MDVYDPIQQATCFVRSLGVTRSVSVSARATKAITFIYTFADLSWEMSYSLNFNVRIHLYSIPINFQKDCIDICFFSRHILWFFIPFCGIVELSKYFSRHLLRLLPIFLSALFIKDEPSPWQPWALTEQEKRSVVPVRSDFWPKESNGLHKWAVVTKANISLDVCTPRAEVVSEKPMTVSHFGNAQRGKEDVSELSGLTRRSLRQTICEEGEDWAAGNLLGLRRRRRGLMCEEEGDWAGNQTYWRPEASPRQTSNYSEIGTKMNVDK